MAARKPYHHGDLREALLAQVGRIIRERGLEYLSLREVAREAGVSHGAPAHHFKDKAGLLTAFAAQGYERMARSVVAAAAASGGKDGAAALEALGTAYVRFAVENPEQFGVMFRPGALDEANPDLELAREAAYGVLLSTLHRCQREGQLEGVDVELATVLAWSTMHGIAGLLLSGRMNARVGERNQERVVQQLARLFVDSLVRKRPRSRTR
jgi:AcrR family transcriptional regulator